MKLTTHLHLSPRLIIRLHGPTGEDLPLLPDAVYYVGERINI